MSPDGVS